MPGQPQTSLSQSATVVCPVQRDAPDGRGLASVGDSTSSPDVPGAIIATGACLVKRRTPGRGLASSEGLPPRLVRLRPSSPTSPRSTTTPSLRWYLQGDGIKTLLNDHQVLILPNGFKVPFAEHGPHYAVKVYSQAALLARPDDPTNELWHERFGHYGTARVSLTLQKLGVSGYRSFKPESCTACLKVRKRKGHPAPGAQPTLAPTEPPSHYGARIDSDTAGPFPESLQGFTHAINFVDRFSRLFSVYFFRGLKAPNISDAARASAAIASARSFCCTAFGER